MMVELSELSAMLAERIEPLARELLPGGLREGCEWRVGSLAGEKGRSLAVRLSGAKAGVWKDFAAGEAGDALDLVAQVLFRGDKARAVKWTKNWLGIEAADPAAIREERRVKIEQAKRQAEAEERIRRAAIERIWLSAEAQLKGTPAAAYLANRAIPLSALGRQPRSLRFHSCLWNVETQRLWPALVGAVVNGQGAMTAIHRIWLEDGRAGWGKAGMEYPKKSLGRLAGGSIRIWRGSSGRSLKYAPDGEPVLIAEGIEDALSLALIYPERRVLCAVSLANMASVELPRQIGEVVLIADNDTAAEAICALDRAIEAHQKAGRKVRIARSPEGKDFNDALMARAKRAKGAA